MLHIRLLCANESSYWRFYLHTYFTYLLEEAYEQNVNYAYLLYKLV